MPRTGTYTYILCLTDIRLTARKRGGEELFQMGPNMEFSEEIFGQRRLGTNG